MIGEMVAPAAIPMPQFTSQLTDRASTSHNSALVLDALFLMSRFGRRLPSSRNQESRHADAHEGPLQVGPEITCGGWTVACGSICKFFRMAAPWRCIPSLCHFTPGTCRQVPDQR